MHIPGLPPIQSQLLGLRKNDWHPKGALRAVRAPEFENYCPVLNLAFSDSLGLRLKLDVSDCTENAGTRWFKALLKLT